MVGYGAGALAVLALSIGLVLIVYGGGLVQIDILNIPAWILGPLGIYTLIYGVLSKKDTLFYSIWGIIMLGITSTSALYNFVNPLIILGILIIIVVVFVFIMRVGLRK
ncbi:MAG: hypothetical protein QW724_05415 [Nitrososphaerota archaeon]